MSTYQNLGYKKVFVSLDGSEQMPEVLDRAITVAANNGAELVVGHIVDTASLDGAPMPEGYFEEREQKFLDAVTPQLDAARALDDIPEVTVLIEAGRIRETLKEKLVDVVKPDIVICGARGLSNIKYALLGSISTFLVRNCDCDVLVVK
ncbi:universal stress protein [Olsenella sp. YH-ols2217]|uniref:Universal stress protein n=1 Tax=Kribbibacterium absianum TaxID=3044210 RepID=A0ABT6ZKZ7_9ACTN|nr:MULTISPECIES: universal stress protein [unclassified Olsenella]MDJ1121716.1 universal stress protein [Olsenella sp. YH-ols2216]MDJ1129724.1 universal stress protein [Olsenella sp. YH-ols2217]